MKKTISDVDCSKKRVLARMDFNVPLEEGQITDDTRIRACLPTIEYLIDKGAKIVLCSHLGRPKGKVVEELRLDPVAQRLSELLGQPVAKTDDCIGTEAEAAVERLGPGNIVLLENTRFHPGEKANDPDFAKKLSYYGEIFVNDAFAAAHRAHASTEGVARYLPGVAGLLMERELDVLARVIENPEHPSMAILGGAKVSDKIGVMERFLEQMEALLIGGAMSNNFLKVKGYDVGNSRLEKDHLDTASRILELGGDKIILPVDVVVVMGEFRTGAEHQIVSVDRIPAEGAISDIGPETRKLFKNKLKDARMVVWNGPVGRFETEPFAEGTNDLIGFLADLDAVTVIGGGDTAAAVNRMGMADRMTHVSTGGGAFLEFMEGRQLPGVAILEDR